MGKSNKTGKSKKDKGKDVVEETLVAEETQVTKETSVNATLDGTNPAGPVAGQKSPVHQTPENSCATDGKENPNALPSAQEQWDTMKAMMAQMAALTKALVPDPVVQVKENKTDADADVDVEIVEVDLPTNSSKKRGDYLSLLAHVSKLGTKHFTGSSDPIVADEWRTRLKRNLTPLDARRITGRTLRSTSWKGMRIIGGSPWRNARVIKSKPLRTLRRSLTRSFSLRKHGTDLSVPTWI
ncbi:hypothetical protein ISN45_Aa01g029100 [Arabidopsis thaliana x Arabidopsis arenosa]|uniref:Uncharacterized protein n=1 Tax=Arabidopsis thaliana x Arabidopsis arenosa TaxID=1240361 RepID=A0A8T2CFY9_9BRAS|nr:hypothetical protein ISN45_Aa01g029100 [Arabidopsis thaliana x Arabidopsis arenosa]